MKVQTVKKENELPFNGLSAKTQRLWQAMLRFKKVLTSVTLAVVLIVGAGVCVPNLSSPSQAFTSKCTLSILNGSVEVIIPGINDMQPGTDGMTLDAGNRVKTSADSTALLTFFDGSTLKLESGTDIEIEQLERNDDQQTITIVLKQWTGETWSHVVKMADRGSHYEIKTPSAVALVRGTQFLTEVDEAGATKVLTTEGLVSVSAQGEEIFLPVGQQTTVEPGTPPSEPETVDISEYIKSQEKLQKGNNGNILSSSKHSNISLNIIPQENNNQGDGQFDDQAEENSQNQGNGQGNGNASAQAAKAEAKASEEAAKDEAKAAEKAAKNEAKAAEETAKAEAKAAEEAAKDAAKAAEEAAKAEAKAAEEAAKDATKAAEEATKAEAKAAEEATKAEAKAEEEATKAAEEATKAAEEAAKAEAKAAEKAAKL